MSVEVTRRRGLSRVSTILVGLAVVASATSASALARSGLATDPDPDARTLSAADWRQIRDLLPRTTNAAQAVPSFSSHAYVKAPNTGAGDYFGWSVAVSGETIVVGAYREDSSSTGVNGSGLDNSATDAGAAYVFTRSAGVWSQEAYLKASNTGAGDSFGWSVAVSGDTIVVGADGEDSAATGVNGNAADDSASNAGAAYVFTRNAGTWSQQAYLKASNTAASDQFGYSVAISGDTIVVGAWLEDSAATGVNGNESDNSASGAGAAYAFTRNAGLWSQQAYLKASNTGAGDYFGWSVAVSGDTIVVGAIFEDSSVTGVNGNATDNSAADAGAAYAFTRSAGTWSQQAYLKASNTGAADRFGWSVAVSGETIVVGARSEDSAATGVNGNATDNSAADAGAAYVFTRSPGVWSQEAYLKASNTGAGDNFAYSVAVSGETIVVGAPLEDSAATGVNGNESDNSAFGAGAAYAFTRNAGLWSQQAYLKASNTGEADHFGDWVAVSGDTIVVGAYIEDSAATGINGSESDNSATNAGAAYVYGPPCATAPFSDVPTDHLFCAEIEWMSQTGISTGFADGTYRPGIDVTRQAMSAFLARFAGAILADCSAPPFTDVAIDHPFCKEIKWMRDTGISTGFADGTYRPGIDVTRQAMSAFLQRMSGQVMAYAKASNTGADDWFGESVAISGDTLVVGAPHEDSAATGVNGSGSDNSASDAGAAYVFARDAGVWSQQAYLKASNTGVGDGFGSSVAISGDTLVVGARFEDSAATGVNGNATDNSATSAGAAYVFTRNAGVWSQQAYLKASNTGVGDGFGSSVAISGETIVVGAPLEDSAATGVNGDATDNSATNAGAAYVFTRSAGVWSQQAYLKASNTGAGDQFGYSVAVSGDTLVIGAAFEDSVATAVNGDATDNSATNAGAAYVFTRNAGLWSQQAYLKASNTESFDNFGYSVAVSGETIVVGAPFEDSAATGVNGEGADNSATDSGAGYAFTRNAGLWSQQAYLKASNTGAGDSFGYSVAVSGETIVVGAYFEDSVATGVNGDGSDNSATNAGAAYALRRSAGVWSQHVYLKASNTESFDNFGYSVATSGGTIVVGALWEDSAATGVNGNGADDSASDAGAAYVFGPPCVTPPFSDVPSDHPFCKEIKWMADNGISTGFADGTYRPGIDVTRQAMSAFLYRLRVLLL